MIWFYSGTPGSGKSDHVAKDIRLKLRRGHNVISTVNIDLNQVSDNGKKKIGKFTYVPILELTPQYLYDMPFVTTKKVKKAKPLSFLMNVKSYSIHANLGEQAVRTGFCFLPNIGILVTTSL